MSDILSTLQYYAAPVLAPVPTAIAVGATLNHTLQTIPGTPGELALIGALSGAIAIEFGGGLMFTGAGIAFARRQWGALKAACAGALLYVAVVVYSIWAGGDSRPLVGSVLVTFVAYLAKAIMDYLREGQQERHTDQNHELAALNAQAEIEKQRARAEQARARAALANGAVSESSGKFPEFSKERRVRWNEVKRAEYAWISAARTVEIVERYQIDERTARNWRENARREIGDKNEPGR